MSLSLSNKELKKWKKARFKLIKDGLEVSDNCSNYIAIANGGLGNGINIQQLLDVLKKYGQVTSLLSCCEKSYAIAVLGDFNIALKCFENLQGYQIIKSAERKSSMLYVFYLHQLPTNLPLYCDKSIWVSENSNSYPNGLLKCENFITPEEEVQLINFIEQDWNAISAEHVQEDLKHRQVVHYGYKFRYGSNDVDCSSPLSSDGLPHFTHFVVQKLMDNGYFAEEPDQLTINKYNPGDGIPPHIDNPTAFAEPLATLSLGSATVMEMKSTDGIKVSLFFPARTLVVFTKDSRYRWTHGIQARKTDLVFKSSADTLPCLLKRKMRISMTFRKILPKTDSCTSDVMDGNLASAFSESCRLPLDHADAKSFEKKLVHNVYDNIAYHFSCTREKPWPKVVEFLGKLDPGATVLDVGCGSGRYLNVNSNIFTVGCDFCSSLVEICKEKHNFVFVCDGLNLPVRSNCFDACICIAVIHHYSTYERQISAIKELLRVIHAGGYCLICVWAAEQKLNNVDSSYLKQCSHSNNCDDQPVDIEKSCFKPESKCLAVNKSHSVVVHKNRTEFKQQNVLVPWKTKSNISKALQKRFGNNFGDVGSDTTYYRFYHVFVKDELENMCNGLPNCAIVDSFYDNGNWSVVLKKL